MILKTSFGFQFPLDFLVLQLAITGIKLYFRDFCQSLKVFSFSNGHFDNIPRKSQCSITVELLFEQPHTLLTWSIGASRCLGMMVVSPAVDKLTFTPMGNLRFFIAVYREETGNKETPHRKAASGI